MRKLVALFAVAAVAGVILGTVVASGAGTGSRSETLHLKLVSSGGYFVDNNSSGTSGGDLFGGAGPVKRDGKQVGRFASSCTAAATEAFKGQCTATVSLTSQGGLALSGVIAPNKPGKMAIVGGTGRFKRAAGEAKLTPIGDGSRVRATLTILRG